ncbi:hypothetical protein A9P82_07245 [Arachidicoccus ginsenosidimutans]|uniref:phage integrase SAM-like domain and Arm DNA-binding domain-containing protein n=1 Tax=Arachidicoccus sp. BS20 TaxID=1850526 RepID=UPI0007F111B9|nr:phage integrase SAM-like domain and Arm DNA-binding domain-containing protein [Arachidicoccus sp. BS20]ANI89102.1 hypothetical protein A9P82_07245 [Arachidicoccus sp. BS20]
MKNERIDCKVILDKRRESKNHTYPLRMRLTFKRKRKYYSITTKLTEEDWNILNSESVKGQLRKIRNDIAKVEETAKDVIKSIPAFSFKEFEERFFNKRTKEEYLSFYFSEYIQTLRKNEQVKTAISYETAINSLTKFKKNIKPTEIDVKFLSEYEKWMLKNKKSNSTIGIYLRNLRSIMNILKEKKLISENEYPFGRKKYQIPQGRNVKKAIPLPYIKQIFDYKISDDNLFKERSKDFWLFSYLANGMNFTDIANLVWGDFSDDSFVFIRSKTKRTTKHNPHPITVMRNEYINAIIKKWGNVEKAKYPDELVFNHYCPTKIGYKSAVTLYSKGLQHKKLLFQNWGSTPDFFSMV